MILRFRIVLITCAVAALAAGTARAQSEDRLAKMKHDLTLTDDQAKKIEPILVADDAQDAKDTAAAGSDAAKLKALKKARKQKTDAQIDVVLTPEQRTKRLALKAEKKKKRAAAPASPAPAAKPATPAPGAKPATPAPSAKPPATTLAPKPTPKPSKQP